MGRGAGGFWLEVRCPLGSEALSLGFAHACMHACLHACVLYVCMYLSVYVYVHTLYKYTHVSIMYVYVGS